MLIVSADLDILASSSMKFDKGLPTISFISSDLYFYLLYEVIVKLMNLVT